MTDDRKPRLPRLSDDERDVVPRQQPQPRRQTPPQGYPFPPRDRDQFVPKHDTPELAAPHEVEPEPTGTHPLMAAGERAAVESENSYRRLRRMSEQNDILMRMNIEQSRVILAIAKNRNDVETHGLEAQIRTAEKRANSVIEDQRESRRWWRSTATQVIAGAIAAGGFVQLLHRLTGC